MKSINQAVILCGGKGTRLGGLTKTVPKPLLEVAGEVLLDRSIRLLAEHGIERVLLIAGHLGDQIERHYGEGEFAGVKVEVFVEPSPLGTSGALPLVKEQLDEQFLLVYGDVFIDFDISRVTDAHQTWRKKGALATLLTRPSDHPWDSHLIARNDEGWVEEFVFEQEDGKLYENCGNVAIYCLERNFVDEIPAGASDFGRDIFPAVLGRGGKLGTVDLEIGGFVRDMGTPDRLAVVERYIARKASAEEARTHPLPLKVAFLDRDGTLNVEKGHLKSPEDLELLPGVESALARLKSAGWRCILITNQPGIARGEFEVKDLEAIHEALLSRIEEAGGSIEAIYYSPYHPETHHGEGVRELRRASDCRKPNSGMIFQAAEERDLNLAECVMIGDSWRDVRAGQGAGVRTVFLGKAEEGLEVGADWCASSLGAAVDHLLEKS